MDRIDLVVLAIAGLATLHALAGPWLLSLGGAGLGTVPRAVLAVALIAPLAFAMGLPFPLVLARLRTAAPALVPWAWGVNGCASVMAAVLAGLLAMGLGARSLMLLGVLAYLLAAVAQRGIRRRVEAGPGVPTPSSLSSLATPRCRWPTCRTVVAMGGLQRTRTGAKTRPATAGRKDTMLSDAAGDAGVLARREQIIEGLRRIIPGEGVIDTEDERRAYESDGLTAYRQLPMVVALPSTTQQVSEVLRCCKENGVKVVPRGSGTSLSGGALPLEDGCCWASASSTASWTSISPTAASWRSRASPTRPSPPRSQHAGFYYAPDPSSQIACSIGGNVAENSGGVHCLKYGLTTNNLLGIEMVLMNGEVVRLGGKYLDADGYDLLGVMTGSEGLLGVVTEVTVRILRKPPTARAVLLGFADERGRRELRRRDHRRRHHPRRHGDDGPARRSTPPRSSSTPATRSTSRRCSSSSWTASTPEVDHLIGEVERIARASGAASIRVSRNEEERELFWAGRKAAFPAVGRISPDYYCMDGTIPRKALPTVLARIREMREEYGLASPTCSTPATATCTR